MQEPNSNSSLEINEPENKMMIFSDDSIGIEKNNSQLSYSRDEQSLSFQIEEEAKVNPPQKIQERGSEPPKRKRRQIFQRFKNTNANESEINHTQEEDIMQTFDQIFKINPNPHNPHQTPHKPNIFSKNKKKIFQENSETKPQSNSNQKFFKTPLDSTPIKRQSQGSVLQNNRLSRIENRESNQFSTDDLEQILSAEIFKESQEKETKISQQKQSILEKQQKQQKREEKPQKQEEKSQDQNKTQLYQKIDMSASSIASSILMKQSRFSTMQSPRNKVFGNFTKKTQIGGFFCEQEPKICTDGITIQRMVLSPTEEQRVPTFIRKLRMLNAIYPNFSSPHVSHKEQNGKLQNIIIQFNLNIEFLCQILQKIKKAERQKKVILETMEDGLNVENFIKINLTGLEVEGVQKLQPKINFKDRPWQEQKVQKALQNYRSIIQYYKGIKLNFKDERAIKKYFDIRKKFWDVERNIRMISEDMYNKIISLNLPIHYYQYLKFLKDSTLTIKPQEVGKMKKLLKKVKLLRKNNEELSRSSIGEQLIVRLQRALKYN